MSKVEITDKGLTKTVYCCECKDDIRANLVSGLAIYPHRRDLKDLPFWQCPTCLQYVGCHHKTRSPLKPLGCIPTEEIRQLRKVIHKNLDPLWKQGLIERKDLYERLGLIVGREYHTAEIRTPEEAKEVIKTLESIKISRSRR